MPHHPLTPILLAAGLLGGGLTAIVAGDAPPSCPVFRGTGHGFLAKGNPPTAFGEKKDLLWKHSLSLPGWASPIVINDTVVVLGASANQRKVWAYDLATGKPKWPAKAVPLATGADDAYAPNCQDAAWDTRVHAGATPASDGKKIFALFSSGQLSALDLTSGEVVWNIALGNLADNNYGALSSLVVHNDKVIVSFQNQEPFIAAYDTANGKELWKTARRSSTWASPILFTSAKGKTQVVLAADPDLTAWDPDKGGELWSQRVLKNPPAWCVGPTPIYCGGLLFTTCDKNGVYALDPDKRGKVVWSCEKLEPEDGEFPDGTSLVGNDQHVFLFYKQLLTCFEAKTGKILAQRKNLPDNTGAYGSPWLVADKLFLPTVEGILCCDAKPDTTFADIGTGTIDGNYDATPAIVGDRIIVRSDQTVYCFGAKP